MDADVEEKPRARSSSGHQGFGCSTLNEKVSEVEVILTERTNLLVQLVSNLHSSSFSGETTKDELQSELVNLQSQIAVLCSHLIQSNQQCQDQAYLQKSSRDALDVMKKRLVELNQIIQKKGILVENLNEKLQRSENFCNLLSNENKSLQSQLSQSCNEKETKIRETEMKLLSRENEYEELMHTKTLSCDAHIQNLEYEITALKEKQNMLLLEKEQLENNNHILQKKLEENILIISSTESLKMENSKISKLYTDSLLENKNILAKNEDILSQLALSENACSDLNKKTADLQAEVNNLETSLQNSNRYLNKEKSENVSNRDKQNQLVVLLEKKDTEINELNSTVQCLEAKLKESECLISNLQDQLHSSDSKLCLNKTLMQTLSEKESMFLTNQEELQNQLESTVSQWQRLQLIAQEKEILNQSLQDDLDEHKRIVSALKRSQIFDLEQARAQYLKTTSELEFKIQGMETEINEKDNNIFQFENDLLGKNEELENIRLKLAELENHLVATNTDKIELEKKLETVESEKSNLNETILKKDTEARDLLAQIENLQKSHEKYIQMSEEKIRIEEELNQFLTDYNIIHFEQDEQFTESKVQTLLQEIKQLKFACQEKDKKLLEQKQLLSSNSRLFQDQNLKEEFIFDQELKLISESKKMQKLSEEVLSLKKKYSEMEEELRNTKERIELQNIELEHNDNIVKAVQNSLNEEQTKSTEYFQQLRVTETFAQKCGDSLKEYRNILKKMIFIIDLPTNETHNESDENKMLSLKLKEDDVASIQTPRGDKDDTLSIEISNLLLELESKIIATRNDWKEIHAASRVDLQKLQEQNVAALSQTDETSQLLLKARGKIALKEEELHESRTLISAKAEKIVDHVGHTETLIEERNAASREMWKLNNQLLITSEKLNDSVLCNHELEKQLNSFQSLCTKKETRISELLQELQSQRRTLEETAKLLTQAEKHNAYLKGHASYLSESSIEREMTILLEVNALKEKLDETENRCQHVEELNTQIHNLNFELVASTRENQKLKTEATETEKLLKCLEADYNKLKHNNKTLSKEHSFLSKDKEQVDQLLSNLKENMLSLQSKENELINLLENKEEEVTHLNKTIENLSESLKSSNDSKSALKTNFDDCMEEAQLKLRQQTDEIINLKSQIADKTSFDEEERSKLTRIYEQKVVELEEKLTISENVCSKSQQIVSELKNKLSTTTETYENRISETKQDFQTTYCDLAILKEQMNAIKKSHSSQISDLKKEHEAQVFILEENNSTLEKSEMELKRYIDEQTNSFDKQKEEIHRKFESQLLDSDEKNRKIELEISTLKRHLEEMKEDHLIEIRNLEKDFKSQLFDIEDKYYSATNELSRLRRSVRSTDDDIEKESRELQCSIGHLEASERELKRKNIDLSNEIQILNEKAEVMETEMKSVLATAVQRHQDETLTLHTEIANLQSKLEITVDENRQAFSSMKSNLESKILDLKTENSQLNEKIKYLESLIEQDVVFEENKKAARESLSHDASSEITALKQKILELTNENVRLKEETCRESRELFQNNLETYIPIVDTPVQEGFIVEQKNDDSTLFINRKDSKNNKSSSFLVENENYFHPEIDDVSTESEETFLNRRQEVREGFHREQSNEFLVETNILNTVPDLLSQENKCTRSVAAYESISNKTESSETYENEEDFQRKVKYITDKLEEEHAFKMRNLEIEMTLKYESEKTTYQQESEQQIDKKMKALKRSYQHKFAKELQRVKRKCQALSDGQESGVIEQLQTEIKELKEVRDVLLKEIDQSQTRDLHQRLQNELQTALLGLGSKDSNSDQDSDKSEACYPQEMFLEDIEHVSGQDLPLEWELTPTLEASPNLDADHHSIWEVVNSKCLRADCQQNITLNTQNDNYIMEDKEKVQENWKYRIDYQTFVRQLEQLDSNGRIYFEKVVSQLSDSHKLEIQQLKAQHKEDVKLELTALRLAVEQIYIGKSKLEAAEYQRQLLQLQETISQPNQSEYEPNSNVKVTEEYHILIQRILEALEKKILTPLEWSNEEENPLSALPLQDIQVLLLNQQEEISSLRSKMLNEYEALLQLRLNSVSDQNAEIKDLGGQLEKLQRDYQQEVEYLKVHIKKKEDVIKDQQEKNSQLEKLQTSIQESFDNRIQDLEAQLENRVSAVHENYIQEISSLSPFHKDEASKVDTLKFTFTEKDLCNLEVNLLKLLEVSKRLESTDKIAHRNSNVSTSSEVVNGVENNQEINNQLGKMFNSVDENCIGTNTNEKIETIIAKLRDRILDINKELAEAKVRDQILISELAERDHSHQVVLESLKLELEHEKQIEIETLQSEFKIQMGVELSRQASALVDNKSETEVASKVHQNNCVISTETTVNSSCLNDTSAICKNTDMDPLYRKLKDLEHQYEVMEKKLLSMERDKAEQTLTHEQIVSTLQSKLDDAEERYTTLLEESQNQEDCSSEKSETVLSKSLSASELDQTLTTSQDDVDTEVAEPSTSENGFQKNLHNLQENIDQLSCRPKAYHENKELAFPEDSHPEMNERSLMSILQSNLEKISTEKENTQRINDRLLVLLSDTLRAYVGVEKSISKKLSDVVSTSSNTEEKRDERGNSTSPERKQEHAAGKDENFTPNTSLVSSTTDEGLESSEYLTETMFLGPDLEPEGEELLSEARCRLETSVDQLLELLETSTLQLVEAKHVQEQLLETVATRTREMDGVQSRCAELDAQLASEIQAREYLALELHSAEGLIAGYSTQQRSLEGQIQILEEQRESLIIDLDSTKSQLEEFQNSKAEVESLRAEVSRQQDLLRENAGHENQDVEKGVVKDTNKTAPTALLAEVSSLCEEKRDMGKQLQNQLDLSRTRLAELESLAEEAERRNEAVIDEKNRVIEDMALQLEKLERQLKSSKSFLDEQLAEREQEREDHQREIDRLEASLVRRDKTANAEQRLQTEIGDLTEHLQCRIASQSAMHQKIADLQRSLDDKDLNVNDLKKWVSQLEKELDERGDVEEHLKQRISNLEHKMTHQLDKSSESLESATTQMEPSAVESVSPIIASPARQLVSTACLSIEEELTNASRIDQNHIEENKILKEQNQQFLIELSGLRNQIDQMRPYNSESNTDTAQLLEQLQRLRDNLDTKDQQLQENEQALERLKDDLNSKNLEMDFLKKTVLPVLEFHDASGVIPDQDIKSQIAKLQSEVGEHATTEPIAENYVDRNAAVMDEMATSNTELQSKLQEKIKLEMDQKVKISKMEELLKEKDDEIRDLEDSIASLKRGEPVLDMSLPLHEDAAALLNYSLTGKTSIQEELEESVANREKEFSLLEETVDELKQKLDLKEKESEQQQEHLQSLVEESEHLKSEISTLKSEMEEKDSEVYTLVLGKKELQEENNDLENMVDGLENQMQETREQLNEKQLKLEEQDGRVDDLNGQLQSAQEEVSSLTKFLQDLQKDYDTLQAMLDEKEKEVDNLGKESSEVLETMIQQQQELSSLKIQVKEKHNVINEKEEELYELQEKLEEMEKIKEEVKEYQHQILGKNQQIEELVAEKEEIQSALANEQSEIRRLHDEFLVVKESLEQSEKMSTVKLTQKEDEIRNLQKNVNDLKDQAIIESSCIKQTTGTQTSDTNWQEKELVAELNEKNVHISELEEQLRARQNVILDMELEKDNLSIKLKDYSVLESKLEDQDRSLKELEQQLRQRQSSLLDIEIQNASLKEENEKLELLRQTFNENKISTDKDEAVPKECHDAAIQVDTDLVDKQVEVDLQQKSLQLLSVSEKLDSAKNELRKLQVSNQTLESEKNELHNIFVETDSKQRQLEEILIITKEQCNRETQLKVKAEERLQLLKTEMIQLKQDISGNFNSNNASSSKKSKVISESNTLAVEHLKSQMSEVKQLNEEQRELLREKDNDRDQQRSTIQEKENIIADMTKEIHLLNDKIAEQESAVLRMKEELASCRSTKDTQISELKDKIRHLVSAGSRNEKKGALSPETKQQISVLKSELRKAHQALQDMQEKKGIDDQALRSSSLATVSTQAEPASVTSSQATGTTSDQVMRRALFVDEDVKLSREDNCFMPERLQTLLDRLKNLGEDLLSMSDIEYLQQQLNSLDSSPWLEEKTRLLDVVTSLKHLLSQRESLTGDNNTESLVDWRGNIVKALVNVYEKEKKVIEDRLQSANIHLEDSVLSLEHRLYQLEKLHEEGLRELLSADRQSLLGEIETLRDQVTNNSQHENINTISRLEQAKAFAETNFKSQIEMLECRLQQESVVQADLYKLLDEERKHVFELSSKSSLDQSKMSKLQSELSSTQISLSRVNDALEREQNRFTSVTDALEEEKARNSHLSDLLENLKQQVKKKIATDESAKVTKLEDRLSLLVEKEEIAQAQLEHMRSKLDQAKSKIASVQAGYEEKIEALHREQVEKDFLLKTYTNNEGSINHAEEERQLNIKLTSEVDCLKGKLVHLEAKYEKEKSRACLLETKLSDQRQRAKTPTYCQEHLQSSMSENFELHQQVDTLECELLNVLDRADELESGLKESIQNSSNLDYLGCSKVLKSDSDEEIKASLDRCCTRVRSVAERLEDLKSIQVDVANTKHSDKQKQVSLEACNRKLSLEVKELRKENQDLKTTLLNLEIKIKSSFPNETGKINQTPTIHNTKSTSEHNVYDRTTWASERLNLQMALDSAEHEIERLRKQLHDLQSLDKNKLPLRFDNEKSNRLYGKYLRSESFRKALIYQKKYLLLLLGGYRDTEQETLAILASMGGYPRLSIYRLNGHSKAFSLFRSAARVVVAITRMQYLVRKWKRATRVGSPVITGQFIIGSEYHQARLDHTNASTSNNQMSNIQNSSLASRSIGNTSIECLQEPVSPPTHDVSLRRQHQSNSKPRRNIPSELFERDRRALGDRSSGDFLHYLEGIEKKLAAGKACGGNSTKR